MKLTVLNVTTSTGTSKTGKPYQIAEVAYKNLDSGKVEAKKIFQFSDVFKRAAEMTVGQTYEVKLEKSDKGFWEWMDIKEFTGEVMPAQKAPQSSPKSTYETPEERAKRQVLIVKQSSIGSAIEMLSVGAKNPPSVEQVLVVAQQFTDWVFSDKQEDLFSLPSDEVQ